MVHVKGGGPSIWTLGQHHPLRWVGLGVQAQHCVASCRREPHWVSEGVRKRTQGPYRCNPMAEASYRKASPVREVVTPTLEHEGSEAVWWCAIGGPGTSLSLSTPKAQHSDIQCACVLLLQLWHTHERGLHTMWKKARCSCWG